MMSAIFLYLAYNSARCGIYGAFNLLNVNRCEFSVLIKHSSVRHSQHNIGTVCGLYKVIYHIGLRIHMLAFDV